MPMTIKPQNAYSNAKFTDVLGVNNSGDNMLEVDGNITAWDVISSRVSVGEIYDLEQEIKDIKERLLIVERDVNMEEKYPELARARNEYERVKGKYETLEYMSGER